MRRSEETRNKIKDRERRRRVCGDSTVVRRQKSDQERNGEFFFVSLSPQLFFHFIFSSRHVNFFDSSSLSSDLSKLEELRLSYVVSSVVLVFSLSFSFLLNLIHFPRFRRIHFSFLFRFDCLFVSRIMVLKLVTWL